MAFALTGCGGSDGDSSGAAPGGVVITGFDGYFKNAVVFVDNNNNGVWDLSSDQFLGLTDSKGQINLGVTKPAGTLALQTVTPANAAQANLIAIDPEKYAGIYTVDMDLPAQPVEHELVFRAPNGSGVISPITDLVAIESGNIANDVDGDGVVTEEEAIAAVGSALGDDNLDPYTDFVEGADADPVLHKTAQILTETKAANPTTYEDSATEIAKEADKAAESITDEDLLKDPSFKPEVPVADNGDVSEIPSSEIDNPDYKTTVNPEILKEIQSIADSLNLEVGTGNGQIYHTVEITDLFQDGNISSEQIDEFVDSITYNAEEIKKEFNFEVYLNDPNDSEKTGQRFLSLALPDGQELIKAGEVVIKLILPANESLKVNKVETEIKFVIGAGEAIAPKFNTDIADALQESVNGWVFVRNTQSKVYELDYSALFSNYHSIEVSSNAIVNGFTISEPSNNKVNISAFPLRSVEQDDTNYTIKLIATSEQGLKTTVELNLPEVVLGTPETCDELGNCDDFPIIKPIEEFDNQEECEDQGGYWYDNSCHADPKPVDPVNPTLGFTQQHFTKGGDWHMGSFEHGDAEIGYASLRVNSDNGQNEFCFASDDIDGNNTLSRNSWKTTLMNLDEGTGVIVPENDCEAATINDDGTISLSEGKSELKLTMLYQNMNGADYQIIMKSNEGELFWLDSTQTDFDTFSHAMAKDGYTEHFLIDDATNGYITYPLIDVFTYTETTRTPSETIIAEGTYDAYSLTENGETWTGLWSVEEQIQGMGQTTVFPDVDEDNNNAPITRHRNAYRDFGGIQIGIGDNNKGSNNLLGDNGFFYITSDNEETITSIYDGWVAKAPAEPDLDPSVLIGHTLYNIDHETLWSNDYSGPRPDGLAYCQSMLLDKNGNVYWSASESTTTCPEVDMSVVGGTWQLDSEKNLITVTEAEDFQMEFKLSDKFTSFTSNSIYQINDVEIEGGIYGDPSTFMAFDSQEDATRRLNTLSTAPDGHADFEMVLPSAVDSKENVLGSFALSLKYTDHSSDNGTMDADINFDLPSDQESCSYLNTHFESFWITGTDVNDSEFKISSTECYDDLGGHDNSANFDFDFDTEIKPDSTVSFIAFAKDDETINSVAASLVWDD